VDNDTCLRRVEASGSASRDLASGDETAERTTQKSDSIIQFTLRELHNLYSSPSIITMIKSRRMRSACRTHMK
jgi:hypothetical protein